MNGSPGGGAAFSVLEARVHSILARDFRTSWPMLMHMAVSDYVVSEAAGGGLQPELKALLASHKTEMVYYAAAPDRNGITPTFHIYRPDAPGWKGGGVKTIEYWFWCMAHMLQAGEGTKAAQAGAALSHFCADLACPVHTVSAGDVHSDYERWLKALFEKRAASPGYQALYAALRAQTKAHVTPARRVVGDVGAAAVGDLVAGAFADWPRLEALWAAKEACPGDFCDVDAGLIALTAQRFGAAANFTADLWYTAFERAAGPLPPANPTLYAACPTYDACLERLHEKVQELMADPPGG